MFRKMCCRAVLETKLLSIIFIFFLSLESCTSSEKICDQAVVERTQQKSGFHRSEFSQPPYTCQKLPAVFIKRIGLISTDDQLKYQIVSFYGSRKLRRVAFLWLWVCLNYLHSFLFYLFSLHAGMVILICSYVRTI